MVYGDQHPLGDMYPFYRIQVTNISADSHSMDNLGEIEGFEDPTLCHNRS